MSKDPQTQRFVCPRCVDPYRTTATDKTHAECEYCGEGMVPMITWVRRRAQQNKQGTVPEKE